MRERESVGIKRKQPSFAGAKNDEIDICKCGRRTMYIGADGDHD